MGFNSEHKAMYIYQSVKVKCLTNYSTDSMQCCTCMQVLGYHSSSAQTQSSVSFNGLKLRLERKFEKAVQQTKNDNKGTYCYRL